MIALVDCNNFFASCERLFRPDLRDKPVLVLSSNDGCVVARSNEVRALGIPMGAPFFQVREAVARGKVQCFSSNFALYSNISQRILDILHSDADQVEVYSIDEAFLNLPKLLNHDYIEWGNDLQLKVMRFVGMPVSVGIAPTKTLAKLASNYAKRHEQVCCLDPEHDRSAYERVLNETAVGDVWGVGRKNAARLESAGVRTAFHLMKAPRAWLRSQLGANGDAILQELRGNPVHPFQIMKMPQKSIMVSRSFGHTIQMIHELEAAVASFASQAAYRLRFHDQAVGSFGVWLRSKDPDGATSSRSLSVKFSTATNDTSEMVGAALGLLKELYDPACGYTKAGVFSQQLTSSHVLQMNLFEEKTLTQRQRRSRFMKAIDGINMRYGQSMIHVGSIDATKSGWHSKRERMSPAYTTDWLQLPLVHGTK